MNLTVALSIRDEDYLDDLVVALARQGYNISYADDERLLFLKVNEEEIYSENIIGLN